jgi:hypothetical protein
VKIWRKTIFHRELIYNLQQFKAVSWQNTFNKLYITQYFLIKCQIYQAYCWERSRYFSLQEYNILISPVPFCKILKFRNTRWKVDLSRTLINNWAKSNSGIRLSSSNSWSCQSLCCFKKYVMMGFIIWDTYNC